MTNAEWTSIKALSEILNKIVQTGDTNDLAVAYQLSSDMTALLGARLHYADDTKNTTRRTELTSGTTTAITPAA